MIVGHCLAGAHGEAEEVELTPSPASVSAVVFHSSRNSSGYFLGAGIVWAPLPLPVWCVSARRRMGRRNSMASRIREPLGLVQLVQLER